MIGLLFALALAGADAPAAGAKPDYVTQPVWRTRPAIDDLLDFYPVSAGGAAGRSVVECTASAQGDLEHCRSIEVRPEGMGFDQAAVAFVSQKFAIQPKDRTGRDVAGRPVRIPIAWSVSTATNAHGISDDRVHMRLLGGLLQNVSVSTPIACPPADIGPGEICARPERDAPRISLRSSRFGWAEEPSDRDYKRARPQYVLRSSVPGGATLVCTLKADGRLTACRVHKEWPAERGFGEAALRLSPKYRLNLPPDGRSVEGETVSIELDWGSQSGTAARMPREVSRSPVQPTTTWGGR